MTLGSDWDWYLSDKQQLQSWDNHLKWIKEHPGHPSSTPPDEETLQRYQKLREKVAEEERQKQEAEGRQ
jgi:hypothetical protein